MIMDGYFGWIVLNVYGRYIFGLFMDFIYGSYISWMLFCLELNLLKILLYENLIFNCMHLKIGYNFIDIIL